MEGGREGKRERGEGHSVTEGRVVRKLSEMRKRRRCDGRGVDGEVDGGV
jgi:hypothetical protein